MPDVPVEKHPLAPFLPKRAKLLMLGSFPPPKNRWCIDFYYPNFNNDMWRIFGLAFFDDKNYFVRIPEKKFDREKLVDFLNRTGVAIYDTATEVRRLKANASDAFLEVVTPTDVKKMFLSLSECVAVVTTGTLATETLCGTFGTELPAIGERSVFSIGSREGFLYRMPSSSRAYPLALEKKTAAYAKMFREIEILR